MLTGDLAVWKPRDGPAHLQFLARLPNVMLHEFQVLTARDGLIFRLVARLKSSQAARRSNAFSMASVMPVLPALSNKAASSLRPKADRKHIAKDRIQTVSPRAWLT